MPAVRFLRVNKKKRAGPEPRPHLRLVVGSDQIEDEPPEICRDDTDPVPPMQLMRAIELVDESCAPKVALPA